MADQQEILDRIGALEQRLERIESTLSAMAGNLQLRDELRTAHERADALARQGLHVVDLLARARKEIHDMKASQGA